MNEEIKAKRDELALKYAIKENDRCGYVSGHDGAVKDGFKAGLDAGYALAMGEARVLVECLKVVENYLYYMGDELTGDDFVGDGALTKIYNEKLNLIEQALKEFKEKVGE